MAGVEDTGLLLPRERDQVAALYEMRWRMFKRNMRRDEAKVSFVFWLTGRLFVFGFSFGSAAVCAFVIYLSLTSRHPLPVSPVFNFIFLGWQGLSLLRGTLPHGVEVELLRFPLRFRTYVALWLSAGLFEGLTVLGTWLCIGLYVGLVLGGVNPWKGACAVLLFFLGNLFISRATFLWFSRALAKRKLRDFILVLFSALGIVPQLMRVLGTNMVALFQRLPIPPWLNHVLHATPGYLAAYAVGANRPAMLWLAVWDVVFCVLLLLGLRRAFLGDDIHEFAAAETKPMSVRRVRAGGGSTAGSPVMAVVGVEWAKLRHGGAAIYTAAAPLLYVVLFGIRMAHSWLGAWIVPAAAAYVGLQLRAFNIFGVEGAGIQTYLLLPVPLRTIMIGKNVFAVSLYLLQMLAAATILVVAAGHVSVSEMLFSVVWMVAYIGVCLAIGNQRSLRSPTLMPTDKLTVRDARRARGAGGWIILATVLGVGLLGTGIIALCVWQHHPGWAPGMMLPFSIAAVWFYRRGLDDPQYVGDIAATEPLLMRVGKAA